MVSVSRTFLVDKPVSEVVAYLADFGNAEQWDPGTQACRRVGSDGPVQVGTTWHNVSKVLGRETELQYTLEVLEPGHITFVGRNDTATSTDDITVTAHPDGAEIVYDATIDLHGLAKLGAPVVKVEFERLGNETVQGITSAIGAL
ncbi:MAG: CdfA [Frankiales bacterium]|nr:CdfA [Frankiales bacterium]